MMSAGVSESKFHMWRAIFALAHADHVVTQEERKFMNKALHEQGFSEEQKRVLRDDMETSSDIMNMFLRIEDQEDRSQFFYFARMLLWCDGDFAAQEQAILTQLQSFHNKTLDFTEIGTVDLQLEDDEKEWLLEDVRQSDPKEGMWDRFLTRFRG